MPKRICIDGFNLGMSKGSGIATYARNLNFALRELGYESQILYGPEHGGGRNDLLNEIALYDAPSPPSPLRQAGELIRQTARLALPVGRTATPIRSSGEIITRQFAASLPPCDQAWTSRDLFHSANRAYAAWGRFTPVTFGRGAGGASAPDVTHWTCPLPLRARGGANLYTIHDLVPLRLPFTTLDNKRRFLGLTGEIAARADHIVTVSEHSKADIQRLLGVPDHRISVTYQAVDIPAAALERPEDDVAREVDGIFDLPWRGYFLFFGAIEPKKNLSRVIEAYLASAVTAPLVIIGGKAWLDDGETRMLYPDLVEKSALRDGVIRRADRIRRYDYLPFSLLVSLIRGARATLLPSLYEGFGLPMLESMILGAPVLASTAGSLPEIAGDGALLVDPYDTQAIRRAIVALDSDADLRAHLIERGAQRAASFSPQAYKQKLADLYRAFV